MRELRRGLLGPPEMKDDEVPDYGVERPVFERQSLGVGLAELDVRMDAARQRHHLVRHIDPDDHRASRHSGTSDITRSAPHIEHPAPRSDLDRVKQWIDHLLRDRAEEVVVAVGTLLPPGSLKTVEVVCTEAASSGHLHPLWANVPRTYGRLRSMAMCAYIMQRPPTS